jgi:exodeoxyribonuclease VII large subunit
MLPFAEPLVRHISLVKLAGEVARAVAEVGKVVVEGEVSRPTTSGANRTYFVLKDRGVQFNVVVPSTRQTFCRVKNGERVAVTGQLEFVVDRGQFQLVAVEVVPVGHGAIAAMIAETRERLRSDGLLDRARLPLPLLPTLVGVLCGTDAAVRADIEAVVASRFPQYPVRFLEVTVSGPGAVESMCAGLDELTKDQYVDVIVLARGGGDATTMLPFSDESLCRAIASCRVPVISAIGHDGDRPLSDEVADARAGTPSIAASMIIPDRVELNARCSRAISLIAERMNSKVRERTQRLQSCSWERVLDQRLERSEHKLALIDIDSSLQSCVAHAQTRLGSVVWKRSAEPVIARAHARLETAQVRIESLSPRRVLERGYAVVRTSEGQVVRNASTLRSGEIVDVVVSAGSLQAEIIRIVSSDESLHKISTRETMSSRPVSVDIEKD